MRFAADGALARFTRDLTADARAGRLEPIRCRADEIARVIDILLRQGKNNPVLVGAAGVGKTAIAEGLAQRIAAGGVPVALRDVRILALDHVALLAGTTYRGQYEERIRSLVEETTQAHDAILFVDELHNLIGQGTAMGVAMDAANMLKPALVRGDFRVIGATTDDEYARWVRGDSALERRFQRVDVNELGAEETLEILRARRERLEEHHHVLIDDSAVVAAVRLTDLFVTDRRRPDRAIDALDEACAHLHAVAGYSPATEQLIRERLRGPAGTGARGPAARRTGSDAGAVSSAQDEEEEEIDPFGQLARDGFAALERLGMELESVFAVRPDRGDDESDSELDRGARAESAPDDRNSDAADAERNGGPERRTSEPSTKGSAESGAERLAEPELRRRLREEGIIVRGQDVARVISVATGRSVRWED